MYQSLIELTNDAILVFDERYQVEFANQMAAVITGYADAELKQSNALSLLGPYFHQLVEELFTHPERYGEKTCSEGKLCTAGGVSKDVEVCIAKAITSEGVRKVYAYIRDISESKRIENELRETNEFFANLIASSVDGIIAADMKGNIIIFNKGAETLTDYTAEEVRGKIHITALYPEGVSKEIMKKLRSPDFGGVGRLIPSHHSLINKDGAEIPCQLSAALIYGSSGNEMASVGIFTDLRPQLLMEQKLKETHLQLASSEKLASLGKLAAGVAHEINNPLGGILIYASLLIENLPEDNPQRQDLTRIVQEAGRCKEIVKSLLEFARQSEPNMEPVDINRAITDGLFFLENQALFHNIQIVKNLDSALPFARGNGSQLKQVFMNIMVNAAEAMHGSGTLTISTSLSAERKSITIEFADTGEGIAEGNLSRIFDPFFTTKDVGKGTGLGLSTAYGIIEGHGSKIDVKSKIGEGTIFTIELEFYPETRSVVEQQSVIPEGIIQETVMAVTKKTGTTLSLFGM
jgi:two-component system NtrC family sensor kinase